MLLLRVDTIVHDKNLRVFELVNNYSKLIYSRYKYVSRNITEDRVAISRDKYYPSAYQWTRGLSEIVYNAPAAVGRDR